MPNPIVSKESVTPNPSTAPVDQLPDVVAGDHRDVDRHTPAATSLPLSAIRRFRGDIRLAVYNAGIARRALVTARAEVEATRFPIEWAALDGLDSLGRAIVYTNSRIGSVPTQPSEVTALLREGRPLRAMLLHNARAKALNGFCPMEKVERIARGSGPVDAADDLVALALLHTHHDLLAIDASVTPEQVERATEVGTALLHKIRPASTVHRPPITNAMRDLMAMRDRLWTLFVQQHEVMERAAGAVWGPSLRRHVPALQARFAPRKRDKKPDAPVAPTG